MFQQGRHNGGKLVAVRSAANELGLTRYAFAVPRRVGKAVTRNLVKRRLREILRQAPLIEGFDVVVTARPAAAEASFQVLKTELMTLLKRARLLARED